MMETLVKTLVLTLQLVFLEGVLSIDNVAVLGSMAARLPDKKLKVPVLGRLIPYLERVSQQKAALEIGLVGAYVGRGLMLLLASFIVRHESLQLVGAGYLLLLVWDHFVSRWSFEPQQVLRRLMGFKVRHIRATHTPHFWKTSLTIELTDLAFSLDNVVAAISLSKNLWLVFVGVALGMVVMRVFAGHFVKLVKLEPALEDGAYLLLLVISLKLLAQYFWQIEVTEWMQFGMSIGVLTLVVLVARIRRRWGWLRTT